MGYRKGVVHPTPLLVVVVVVIWALVLYFLVSKNILKLKVPSLSKEPTPVELKTEYNNPFDKKTQFVNPFDQTKNPFAVAK